MTPDPYEVLGVEYDADFEIIKARYRILVRENHPDIAPDKAAANERMVVILEAWRTLSDPDRRARVDAQRISHNRPAPPAPTVPVASKNSSKAPQSNRRSGKSGAYGSSGHSTGNARAKLLFQVNEAAQIYFKEGRADDAISLCKRVLKSDSRNVEATVLLGDIYAAVGEVDKARLMFDRALTLQPSNVIIQRKRDALRVNSPAEEHGWRPPAQSEPPEPEPEPSRGGLFGLLRSRRDTKK